MAGLRLNRFIAALSSANFPIRIIKLLLPKQQLGMLKFLFTFGTGLYCGLHAAQQYPEQVPLVPSPQELAIKIREWLDEYSKPDGRK